MQSANKFKKRDFFRSNNKLKMLCLLHTPYFLAENDDLK